MCSRTGRSRRTGTTRSTRRRSTRSSAWTSVACTETRRPGTCSSFSTDTGGMRSRRPAARTSRRPSSRCSVTAAGAADCGYRAAHAARGDDGNQATPAGRSAADADRLLTARPRGVRARHACRSYRFRAALMTSRITLITSSGSASSTAWPVRTSLLGPTAESQPASLVLDVRSRSSALGRERCRLDLAVAVGVAEDRDRDCHQPLSGLPKRPCAT